MKYTLQKTLLASCITTALLPMTALAGDRVSAMTDIGYDYTQIAKGGSFDGFMMPDIDYEYTLNKDFIIDGPACRPGDCNEVGGIPVPRGSFIRVINGGSFISDGTHTIDIKTKDTAIEGFYGDNITINLTGIRDSDGNSNLTIDATSVLNVEGAGDISVKDADFIFGETGISIANDIPDSKTTFVLDNTNLTSENESAMAGLIIGSWGVTGDIDAKVTNSNISNKYGNGVAVVNTGKLDLVIENSTISAGGQWAFYFGTDKKKSEDLTNTAKILGKGTFIENTRDYTGSNDYGIAVWALGSNIDIDDIAGVKANGVALYALNYGKIDVKNTTILSKEASALYVYNNFKDIDKDANFEAKIIADKVNIITESEDHAAVLSNSLKARITLTDSNIYSIGTALSAANGGIVEATLDGNTITNGGDLIDAKTGGQVILSISNMSVLGDIRSDSGNITDKNDDLPTSQANMNLGNNSFWAGNAYNGGDITLANSATWMFTDDSNVSNITNTGNILFGSQNIGQKLTVQGDYISDGGHIVLKGYSDGNTSIFDKLHVEGNTSGNTTVSINNIGGIGTNINDIRIIQVDGNSDGTFTQSGRVLSGAHEYFLTRGESNNSNHWYLNNTQNGSAALFRPEAGGYVNNLAIGNTLFNTRLHDRLGETKYIDPLTGEKKVTTMWMRNVYGHNNWKNSDRQLKTQSNRYVLQVGGDLMQWTTNGQDRYHLGMMIAYGNVHGSTDNRITGHSAKSRLNGYSVGLYGTYFDNEEDKTGLYVDGWAQYSWLTNHVNGKGLAGEKYDSKGATVSIEPGYTFLVHESQSSEEKTHQWFLQPKA